MAEGAPKKPSGTRSSCLAIFAIAAALIVLLLLGIPVLLTRMLTDPKPQWIVEDYPHLQAVRDAIEKHYHDHGRIPETDDFGELVRALCAAEGPSAPYLTLTGPRAAEPALDYFGKPFFYTHDRKGRGYVLGPSREAEIIESAGGWNMGFKSSSFRFSQDGRRLAVLFPRQRNPFTWRYDGMVVVVDVKTGRPVSHMREEGGGFCSYRFLGDSHRLVTTGTMPVTVWDTETGARLERPLAEWGYRMVEGSPVDGKVTVQWNDGIDAVEREKQLRELAAKGLLPLPFCLLFSGPDRCAVTRDFSRLIVVEHGGHSVWNAETGNMLRNVPGDGGTSVAVSVDGKWFAIGRADGRIRLYDAESGAKQTSLSLGEVYISSVAFSPDGTLLAAGCSSLTLDRNQYPKPKRGTGEVRVLDVATGEQRASFGTGVRDLPHVGFSPDGKVLVAEDGFVSLGFWNVETWEKVKSIIPWPEKRSGR